MGNPNVVSLGNLYPAWMMASPHTTLKPPFVNLPQTIWSITSQVYSRIPWGIIAYRWLGEGTRNSGEDQSTHPSVRECQVPGDELWQAVDFIEIEEHALQEKLWPSSCKSRGNNGFLLKVEEPSKILHEKDSPRYLLTSHSVNGNIKTTINFFYFKVGVWGHGEKAQG